jgi:membrane protein
LVYNQRRISTNFGYFSEGGRVGLPDSFLSRWFKSLGARRRRISYQLQENKTVRFLLALGRELGKDNISNGAASVSYYAFLSLFPLLLSLLAIFGLFFPSETILQQIINLVGNFLPGSRAILENNISYAIQFRGPFGVLGVLGLIWSGSAVFGAISHAINKAWDIEYLHPFYIRKPREFLILFVCGILFLLSLGATTVVSQIGKLDFPLTGTLVKIGTAAIAFFFSLTVITLIHKFAPITVVSWRHVWPGALLSAVVFEIAKTLFVIYLNNFNRYDIIYGSVASVIVILVWIYFSAFILLLGAEFSSMLFRLKREGESAFNPEQKPDIVREL